jgi:hypothetical protein
VSVEVQLCIGSDCRKKRRRIRKLRTLLQELLPVKKVKCQDVCSGPVVVVRRAHERFWFKKIRNKKSRRELVDFLTGEEVGQHLKKRLVKRKVEKTKVQKA